MAARFWWLAVLTLALGACVTAPPQKPDYPAPAEQPQGPVNNQPQIPAPVRPGPPAAPSTPLPTKAAFASYPGWNGADMRPALSAFARSCTVWARRDASAYFNSSRPDLGRMADWSAGCAHIGKAAKSSRAAREFFETWFHPQSIRSDTASTGLITGYFQPEIDVRRRADREFSEPILSSPKTDSARRLPRSRITADMADVIAYGRPIDVFFMQVQGSGILKFRNNHRIRAAYAANNGYPYTSIGGVLVRAGYMTTEQASKQAIEDWMAKAGPKASQMLMNENKRYIFFEAQALVEKDGPTGAMNVPLTAMGSMAVDPAFHTYGVPIWLNVKIPIKPGDYRGQQTGLLVVAQDTGKAIKGLLRGDLYFGSGNDAGARAGVMKHPGTWTVLLPRSLMQGTSIS